MIVSACALLLATPALAAATEQKTRHCRPRVGSKLGFRVVEVCGDSAAAVLDDEGADRLLPPFFILAEPVSCAGGEHEAVDCAWSTPLEHRPAPEPFRASRATRIDGATAHRVCAMRYGGRLPTLIERLQAKRQLGLVTLEAVPSEESTVRLLELPEWVEDGDCANPSVPGARCSFNVFPPVVVDETGGRRAVACSATIAETSERAVGLGGLCPGGRCLLRLMRQPFSFALDVTCAPAPAAGRVAPPRPFGEIAAFRCVMPANAVDSIRDSALR